MSNSLFALLLPLVVVFGNNQPENAVSCEHRNAEFEYQCRNNFALGYRCLNSEACAFDSPDLKEKVLRNPNDGTLINAFMCSDSDYAHRVGMLCTHFPYYLGSYPLSSLNKYEIWETYSCNTTTTAGSSTYCSEWEGVGHSDEEYSIADYTCNTESSVGNYRYCLKWTGTKTITEKCPSDSTSCSPNCQFPEYCERTCDNDDGGDCSFHTSSEYKNTSASCISVNQYGVCTKWKQEEYGANSRTLREYEEFICREYSASGFFCKQFLGNTDSKSTFELATCECVDVDVDFNLSKTHCSEWQCFKVGVNYWFANYLWILLVAGNVVFFKSWYTFFHDEDDYDSKRAVNRFIFFVNLGLLYVILWHTGVVATIIAGICVVLPSYFGFMYLACKEEDEDMNNYEILDRCMAALVGLDNCADAPVIFHFLCGCLCRICELDPAVDEENRERNRALRREILAEQENQARVEVVEVKQLELMEKELEKSLYMNRKGVSMKMGSNGLTYCGKYVGAEGFSEQGIHNSTLYCGPDSGPQCKDCAAEEEGVGPHEDTEGYFQSYGLVPVGEDVL